MTKSTAATPSGYNAVPPDLEAINVLQHLERFTNKQKRRVKQMHSNSFKNKHKFKKLSDDAIVWKKRPNAAHSEEMKKAWYYWQCPGIKELPDTPSQYLFTRAILPGEETEEDTLKEDPPTESSPNGMLTAQLIAHPIKSTKSVPGRILKGTPDRILAGTPQ
jgi:hypothetical protein